MPDAQHLGHGPRLGDAASGSEWGIAIGDFTQRAKTMRTNLLAKRFHEAQREVAVTVNTKMSESEGAQQPAPGSSLMICAVTLCRTTAVMPLVSRVSWIEAAQAMWSQQHLATNVDNRSLLFLGQRRFRK